LGIDSLSMVEYLATLAGLRLMFCHAVKDWLLGSIEGQLVQASFSIPAGNLD
jgi:hypothetical protein